MLKVAFHVNELEKWSVALGNIRNLLKGTQEADIKLVVNGGAITGYLNSILVAEMTQESQSVSFEACQNALDGHEIKVAQLPIWVNVVPAGVIRLIELQQVGYAYIKP